MWMKGSVLRFMSHIATSAQQWDISTNIRLFFNIICLCIQNILFYFCVHASQAKHLIRVIIYSYGKDVSRDFVTYCIVCSRRSWKTISISSRCLLLFLPLPRRFQWPHGVANTGMIESRVWISRSLDVQTVVHHPSGFIVWSDSQKWTMPGNPDKPKKEKFVS
jgi:hypothetical protein